MQSSRAGDVIATKPSTSNYCRKMKIHVSQLETKTKNQSRKDRRKIQDHAALRESPVIASRSLKRTSPYGWSVAERVQKLKPADGWKQRMGATPVFEKVDAVAYPKEISGKKDMHASFNIISNGYNQMKREKRNDVLGYSGVGSPEISSSDSDACSVGSCSVTSQVPEICHSRFIPMHCQETDTLCSDAESSYASGSERKSLSLPPKEEVEASIRRLELHAYRSTLEALYASGPLSWEQEAMLTNLRIMLHISNDEHLKELKHLISTKTAITFNY